MEEEVIVVRHTVVSFGEVLWDLLPGKSVLGGAPFNFAFRINELGERGIPISRLGVDPLGQQAYDQIARLGMDTGYLQWDESHPTGTVKVTVDPAGNPDFFIVPHVAYDFIQTTSDLEELAARADCICYGTLVQRSERSCDTLTRLLEKGLLPLKFLDLNLRENCYSLKTIISSLETADVLKLNQQELVELVHLLEMPPRALAEDAGAILRQWQLQAVLITLGEAGLYAVSRDGLQAYDPGYRVAVVDTVGSGDACAAAFVHCLLQGRNLQDSCRFGNLLGALAATKAGGTAPIHAGEIERLAGDSRERIVSPDFANL